MTSPLTQKIDDFVSTQKLTASQERYGERLLLAKPHTLITQLRRANLLLDRINQLDSLLDDYLTNSDSLFKKQKSAADRIILTSKDGTMIDFDYADISSIVNAILKGTPAIEVQAVGPYAKYHLKQDGKIYFNPNAVPADESIGLELVSILKFLASGLDTLRPVILIDDYNGHPFTRSEQFQFIASFGEHLKSRGVISSTDQPGKDYVLLRESSQVRKVPILISEILANSNAKIEKREDGLFMRFPDSFLDALELRNNSTTGEFKKRGIRLGSVPDQYESKLTCFQYDGVSYKPTCAALDASTFIDEHDPTNRDNSFYYHWIILHESYHSQQDKVFALLLGAKVARAQANGSNYHNVFFKGDIDKVPLNSELVLAAIIIKLQSEITLARDAIIKEIGEVDLTTPAVRL